MKKLLIKTSRISAIIILIALLVLGCKKKGEDEDIINDPAVETEYVLKIQNGAQTIDPNETLIYSAILIDDAGNVSSPSGVSWSVGSTSVATISSSGVLTSVGTGSTIVTASYSKDGKTYTASVPIGIYAPTLFAVAPSAIIYEVGGSIQLETVYFTTGATPTYTYSSSNSSVASVNSTGEVSFIAAGSCVISVTASTLPGSPFEVPVLVIGMPEVALPITRIELNKAAADLFKDETAQFSATAYNANGVVSGTSFTWTSLDPSIAIVSSNGLVTPIATGETYIQVTASGIMAQAEILVNPDTVVIVSPFYKEMSPGQAFQFTAVAYKNERAGLSTTYPITFNWMIPDYGPGFEMFSIGTVDNNGNVNIKNDAIVGIASFVGAYDQANPSIGGAALIMIDMGLPF